MPSGSDTLMRQWQMLRLIPRYPHKLDARQITERLHGEGYAVSKRTVERDLQALSNTFPLALDDREKPYGWSWMKEAHSFDIPGMSVVEALAFVLARDHMQPILPAALAGNLAHYFRQADATLAKAEQHKLLSHWAEKVAVVSPVQPLLSPSVDEAIVAAVHEGVLQERQLLVSYRSRTAGHIRKYLLHPLGLVVRGVITYLVATVDSFDDVLSFAIHRLVKVEVTNTPRRRPEGFSLKRHIDAGSFGFGSEGLIRLAIRFDAGAAEHLRETPLSKDQKIIDAGEGKVIVKATVLDTQQLRWWILGFGEMAEVLSPAGLREVFAQDARNSAANYG